MLLRQAEMKIVNIDGIGEVRILRSRRARRYSISISQNLSVRVTVPWYGTLSAGGRLARDNAAVIASRLERMRRKISERDGCPENDDIASLTAAQKAAYVEELRRLAHMELPALVEKYAEILGLQYGKVFIKHNSSNWGSCSVRGNINLNLNLMRLPEDLRVYVVLHELSHLRYMNHGEQFHAYLSRACKENISPEADEMLLSRRLRRYRLV